ncbi:uncharacterized protein E0L32_002210 [Thyridium curvatum]|uniref:Uncharacterized protein n=1 Tax=Thyridium curvatum TaxID=1093900 RepID=A0A507AKY8_9PEZI|nr:uncharacterized protein E0L32_002210 [Thyridium curvatum]TPX06714.1 hypothetical protein E0L32_002210 [Thyridium curvatum]
MSNLCSDNDDVFTSSDHLSALVIWNSETLEHAEQATEGLVVLFSGGKGSYLDRGILTSRALIPPMTIQKSTFETIASAFALPPTHVRMHRDGTTMLLDEGDGGSESGTKLQKISMQNSFTSTYRFSASLSYDPERRLTKAFIHGLLDSEIATLSDELLARRGDLALPTLLPFILLTYRTRSAIDKVGESHKEIIRLEQQTGVNTRWHPKLACCDSQESHYLHSQGDGVNLNRVTSDLTSLVSKLAFVDLSCHTHTPMLETLDSIDRRVIEEFSGKEADCTKRLRESELRLRRERNFLRSSLEGTRTRADYLSKRAQAQVQTIYSLIAQRDNAIALKDNIALKAISEDQKRIALAATRDGAAMRMISIITTVFLPATFTAPEGGKKPVSDWVWLYFLITALLSVLVMTWWHINSRRKIREIR